MDEKTQRKNVYLSFHKNFVREQIPYTDKRTGEQKTFNQVTIPNGTVIDGKDMGGYEFSPLYVNQSRFRGENWRDIPLLADREVWLQKSVLDPDGNPVIWEASDPRLKEWMSGESAAEGMTYYREGAKGLQTSRSLIRA